MTLLALGSPGAVKAKPRRAALEELGGVLRIASVLVEQLGEDSCRHSDRLRLLTVARQLCDAADELEIAMDGGGRFDAAHRINTTGGSWPFCTSSASRDAD